MNLHSDRLLLIEMHITLDLIDNEVVDEFTKVASTEDIQPSKMKAVEFGDETVCVANVEGKFYAIGNVCSHMGGPLADGTLEGFEVECPWHGSRFNVRTGEVTRPPASKPEPTYEVKIDGNSILIRKP
jgi:nitrite reductase/ring-hydroxylating ferredoxin subunit